MSNKVNRYAEHESGVRMLWGSHLVECLNWFTFGSYGPDFRHNEVLPENIELGLKYITFMVWRAFLYVSMK